MFKNEGVCWFFITLYARTNFGIIVLIEGLQRYLPIVLLLLVVVDNYQILILRHRDKILTPRTERCYLAFVLLGSLSHDLFALHIELLDGT